MSKDINVLTGSDTAVNNSVTSGSTTQTNVLISSPIEVLNTDYVIGTRGLYNGSLLGGVPSWVDEAVAYNVTQKLVDIQNQFSTLDLSFHNEVDRIDDEIVNVENSVLLNLRSEINTTKTDILAELHQDYIKTANTNEAIAELNTNLTSSFQSYTDTSISNLEQVYKTIASADKAIVTAKTELTSTFNSNIANALVEYQTKATAGSVESRIRTDLSTQIDNNISSLSEVYLSKVDATDAEASLTSTLTATFNTGLDELSASIQTTDEVVAGYFSEYTDESVDPKLGQFKLIDGVQYQYLGGYLGINSDGWVRTDQSTYDYTVGQTNYLTNLVNAQASALQGQIDGSITTWFDTGSPEFSELFATYQSDTNNTDDNSQDLTAGNFVWNVADNQMFKYTGSDANIDLNSVDYVGSSDWLAIYRINPKEETWYDTDGIDTSNNYYWYEDGKIRPLKDADTPATIEERGKHIGDLYYDRDTGYGYRFAYEDIVDIPDEGVIFSWIRITDVDITKALGDAANAQASADGKVTMFSEPTLNDATNMSNSWTSDEKIEHIGDLNVYQDKSLVVWDGENWVDTTNSTANEAHGWAGSASKLIGPVDKNGKLIGPITGWAFAAAGDSPDANQISEFAIHANHFYIQNSDSDFTDDKYRPFEINGSDIYFNGKVTFANTTGVPAFGSNNLLTNSEPALGNETDGWIIGGYTTDIVPDSIRDGWDVWRPTGSGSVAVHISGEPTSGGTFDVTQTKKIPVKAGKRYEATSLISSHRCNSKVVLSFYNSDGEYMSKHEIGTVNTSVSHSGLLSAWTRYGGFITIPTDVATVSFCVRSVVTGKSPYCFVAQAYLGEATELQTEFSPWSEGILATYNLANKDMSNVTTIDGGKITTGYINANRIKADSITADKIKANAITADKIKADSITADKIKANAITADDITTGTLTADVIKSKSITYSEVKKGTINVAGDQTTFATHTYDNSGGSSTLIVVNTLIPGDALKTIRLYKDGEQIYQSANNLDWSYTLSIVDDPGDSTYVVKMDGYDTGDADVTYYISFIYFKK